MGFAARENDELTAACMEAAAAPALLLLVLLLSCCCWEELEVAEAARICFCLHLEERKRRHVPHASTYV